MPLTIRIAKGSEDDPCLNKLKKQLAAVATTLGLDLSGKTITLQYPDPKADPETSPQLDPNTLARTDPVANDGDAVTLTVAKSICDLPAHDLLMVLAHELDHVRRLTGDDGHVYRDLYFTYVAALLALDSALKAKPRIDSDISDATKKKKKAKKAALEQLKKEENDAFDFVKKNKDKLGLTDEDVEKNEHWREDETKGIDKLISQVGR